MANINDYKIVSQKSQKYFDLLVQEKGIKKIVSDNKQSERLGFYLFILEFLTSKKDTNDLVELITDTDFNKFVFDKKDDDFGVDAIHIDEDDNHIQLFNFKYRNKFKSGKQSINETILSTKFINALMNEDFSMLGGKIKEKAKTILEKLTSNDIWQISLYIISNEEFELEKKDDHLIQLEKTYNLETITIGLNEISEFISLRPVPIDAELILDNDAIMSYSESSISSSTSYILRLPLYEIIRITSNNRDLRNEYNIEDISILSSVDIDYSVLFDNVRGLVIKSKYNKNIQASLLNDVQRFFMYNNGLTITASDIIAKSVNANKKVRLTIKSLQVLNGGQTLRTIHHFNKDDKRNIEDYLSNGEILVRVFKTSQDQTLDNRIAEYTNSQNSISNIDLKSLRTEQLQLEQYLSEHNIIYSRKSGDTGLDDTRSYLYKISMERYGQILFSLKGFPEKASNQKKYIFDKYYNDIFGVNELIIDDSPKIIQRYFEIKDEYGKLKKSYSVSEQKVFYILYLDTLLEKEIKDIIIQFEKIVSEYEPDPEKETTAARKLIQSKFKEYLDKKIQE